MLQKDILISFETKSRISNNSLLSFWVSGPFATIGVQKSVNSPFLINHKKTLVFLEQTKNFWNFLNSLSTVVYAVFKFFFLELFITGKGYKFERTANVNGTRCFSLFLGLKCVFVVKPASGCFVVGLNKRKVVICSSNSGMLMSYARQLQLLKYPTKYYMQGLNLRFKVRKLQNFRHKKRK